MVWILLLQFPVLFQNLLSVSGVSGEISDETLFNLEDNLLLFFTGYSRSASKILKDQNDRSKQNDQAMLDNLHFTKDLGYQSLAALEDGNLGEFGRLMDVHWQRKKARSAGMRVPVTSAGLTTRR